jgi:hypothetical protein
MPPPRLTSRPAALLAALLAGAAALAGAAYAATPRDHVAEGCFWWLATTVDRVTPGQAGCLRGYFAAGGALAEGPDSASYRLSFFPPEGGPCPFRPGDPVVVRYRAVFDDGRTIVLVQQCR